MEKKVVEKRYSTKGIYNSTIVATFFPMYLCVRT